MPANPALPVLATLLVSLMPIAVYCLILSSINRRPEPLLVRGVWDFAGVMFAASGMVLWAVPAMLVTLHQRSIAGESTRSFEDLLHQWWAIWAIYFGLVVSGGIFLLWLRRPITAIYNVQCDMLPQLMGVTLQRLGHDFAQNSQHQFLIALTRTPASTAMTTAITTPEVASTSGLFAPANESTPPYSAAVEIEPLPSMCHATLHWYETEPAMRLKIEEELRKQIAGARPADNPAAIWQLGVGILLFGAIFLSVLFFILASIYPHR